ncbi:MAG TPA: hypothetical protein VFM93_04815 [Candidatus Limnocylindria bacterium]|nr:hypothetical protein [Candidatus Limnocylindria bacterium]
MAKPDERPVDVGVASLHGKDEATAIEWWKERLRLIAAVPQEVARVGALTPTLRELVRIADDAERKRLTRARLIAFGQLPPEQRQPVAEARKKAWEVDRDVLERDQKLVDEILPTLDPGIRSVYPTP